MVHHTITTADCGTTFIMDYIIIPSGMMVIGIYAHTEHYTHGIGIITITTTSDRTMAIGHIDSARVITDLADRVMGILEGHMEVDISRMVINQMEIMEDMEWTQAVITEVTDKEQDQVLTTAAQDQVEQ